MENKKTLSSKEEVQAVSLPCGKCSTEYCRHCYYFDPTRKGWDDMSYYHCDYYDTWKKPEDYACDNFKRK